ncbi:hypothetical protein [Streptomyces xanthochromogenes]|uniref:hypothetical protein n=1 Tax=Streptomyces xanthochromogenes TaxID=67384 RepID=UPI001671D5F9|nr:hypothetical protein [Streptomyces xanthochromogenes]
MPTATFRVGGTEILHEDRRRSLANLADDLQALSIECHLDYRPPDPGKRGVTWYEVLGIYLGTKALEGLTGYAVNALAEQTLGRVISWAKDRLRRHETNRPQSITIYGPDNQRVLTVLIRSPEQIEITDHTSAPNDGGSHPQHADGGWTPPE